MDDFIHPTTSQPTATSYTSSVAPVAVAAAPQPVQQIGFQPAPSNTVQASAGTLAAQPTPVPLPVIQTPQTQPLPVAEDLASRLDGIGVRPTEGKVQKSAKKFQNGVKIAAVFSLFMLLTVGAAFLFNQGQKPITTDQSNARGVVVPEQDLGASVILGDLSNNPLEEEQTLIVNGDIRLQGALNFASGEYIGGIVQGALTANQTYTLPDASGELCLSSNNCSFLTAAQLVATGLVTADQLAQAQTTLATAAQLAQLQSQLNGIVVTSQPLTGGSGISVIGEVIQNTGVLTLNGQSGSVVLTGGSGILVSGSTITNNGVLAVQGQTGSVSFTGGSGISLSGTTINNDGVLSLAGQTGALNLVSGPGISISGLTVSNNGVTSTQGLTGNVVFTAGSGIDITGTAVSNTGVTLLTGTANQVAVSGGTGSVTLSLPQDIAVTSTPTFGGLTLNGALTATSIVSAAGLSVGNTTQPLTLQGSTASLSATNGANTMALTFVSPTSNVTYRFINAAAGTYDVCTTTGNCSGVGGGVTTSGGTPGTIPKFTSSQGIGDSLITDDGTTITINGDFDVTGVINGQLVSSDALFTGNVTVNLDLTVDGTLNVNTITPSAAMTVGASGQSLLLQGSAVTLSSTDTGITNSLVFATPAGSNKTITLPNLSGTVCLTSGNCAGVGGTGDVLQGGNSYGTAMTVGTNDNHILNFETNSATAMTILTNGNVGIGATNPQSRLEIAGGHLKIVPSNTSAYIGFGSADGVTGFTTGRGVTAIAHQYEIYDNTAGVTRFFVDSAGEVGIGNSNPQHRLDVTGTFRVTGTVGSIYTSSGGNNLDFSRPAANYITATDASGSLQLGAGGVASVISISSASSANTLTVVNGTLGVNATSPGARLHVGAGTILIDNTYTYQARNNAATAISLLGLDASNHLNLGATSGMGNTNISAGTGSINFATSSVATAMSILNGGSVEIGATGNGVTTQPALTIYSGYGVGAANNVSLRPLRWATRNSTDAIELLPVNSYDNGATLRILTRRATGGGVNRYSFFYQGDDQDNGYPSVFSGLTVNSTTAGGGTGGVFNVFSTQLQNDGTTPVTAPGPTIWTDGTIKVTLAKPANVGLVLRGAASQTANLQEWQNSAGSVGALVTADGLMGANYGRFGDRTFVSYNALRVTALSTGDATAVFRAMAAQTADLQEWQNSAGAKIAYVTSNGDMYSRYTYSGQGGFTAPSAGVVPVYARGAASQSADLQQWQNSAGTTLAAINAIGTFNVPYIQATAGTGSYLEMNAGAGGVIVHTRAANNAGLVIRGSSSQVGGLLLFQDSGGTNLATIAGNGNASFPNATIGSSTIEGNLVLNAPAGAGGPYFTFQQNGAGKWLFYQANSTPLYIRDAVNGRMHITMNPGAAGLADTVFADKIKVVAGSVGQSANLQEWQNSSTNNLARIANDGTFVQAVPSVGTATLLSAASGPTNRAELYTLNAGTKGLIIQGAASQTANLQEWRNSSGTALVTITANGGVINASGAPIETRYLSTVSNTGVILDMGTGGTNSPKFQNRTTASNVALTVQGMASQTGDLQQWQDSSGNIMARVQAGGHTGIQNSGGTEYAYLWNGGAAKYLSVGNDLGTDWAASFRVSGDANPRLAITSGGTLSFGDGTGTADTNLYRSAANTLKTDDNFVIQTASNSTNAFQVQNAAGVALLNADTQNLTLAVGGTLTAAPQTITAASLWTSRTSTNSQWTSVTYGNGIYVAVAQADSNRVMTSPDGITWTARIAAEATTWQSVTFGNGLFVAVSTNGTNRVMTSPDGITWTGRTAAEANAWQSVTYGNGQFVAVAQTGTNRVMTSSDGITWTARAAAQANQWWSVVYGEGLFVAISQDGTNRVMTSPDGITWTARTAAEANFWQSVTYGNEMFVAVAATGTNRVMTSPDGITWTARAAAEANFWISVTYGNGQFVAVAEDGTNRVMTSPDGITWTARAAAEASSWRYIAYGNGLFVSVAVTGTNRVMTSLGETLRGGLTVAPASFSFKGTDLLTRSGYEWTARTPAEVSNWRSVAYGNGVFVAVSQSGTNRVMTSSDGVNWTGRTAAQANQWFAVTYGNGLFVAVTRGGVNRIMTSPDGITWTVRTAPEANQWAAVIYGNGLFVAVAWDGTNRVMTSPDGITWTARAAAEANIWESVTYGSGLFVAVAQDGTNRVMTSPDGITWTARAAAEANYWAAVTYGNGQFVAVAQTGTNRVMTSPDGITWTARAAAQANTWQGIAFGDGLFVAVSQGGANRIMTSSDGITWTARTHTAGNQWVSVAYGNGMFVAVSQGGTNSVMTSGAVTTQLNFSSGRFELQGNGYVSGSLGIGNTNPAATLSLGASGSGKTYEQFFDGAAGVTVWTLKRASDSAVIGQYVPTSTSGGGWRFFAQANETILLGGGGGTGITVSGVNAIRFNAYGAGTLVTDVSGNITASSDERLKDVQGNFNRGLADLLNVDPIMYKWNGLSGMETEGSYAGFSAQNIQVAIPEAVSTDSRGYLTLQDRPLLAASVNAIKELNTTDNALEARVIALETAIGSNPTFASLNVTGHTTLSSLTVSGNVNIQGTLTVANATVTGNLTVGGHIITAGSVPTYSINTAAVGAATVTIEGNDTAGTITLVVGAQDGPEELIKGKLATISFAQAFSANKKVRVQITAGNEAAVGAPVFVDYQTISNTAFELSSSAPLEPGKTYIFNYFVVE